MHFATPCLSSKFRCNWIFNIVRYFYLMLALSMDSSYPNRGIQNVPANKHKNEWIYDDTSVSFWMHKISCFKRAEKIYIGGSCPGLGIGISVSGVSVGPSVIDPNEVCCITRCTFLLTYIIARARDKLKRPTKNLFTCFHLMKQKKKLRWGLKVKRFKMQFAR